MNVLVVDVPTLVRLCAVALFITDYVVSELRDGAVSELRDGAVNTPESNLTAIVGGAHTHIYK